LATNTLIPLVLYMALVLAASLHGLAVSGHFPLPRDGKSVTPGAGVLFASIVLVIVCAVAGIAAALRLVPWYAAIIGGGLCVLGAPLVLQWFSDRFVDGRGALLTFPGAVLLLTVLLMALTH
jgi:hypothetical protein